MRTRLTKASLCASILLTLLFLTAGNALGQFNPNSFYRIIAKHSRRCLSVAGGNSFTNNGVGVIQWDCIETEDNQKWQILPVGFGFYKIVAKHSGKSLEVRGGVGALANGEHVQQWDYWGGDNQKWWFNPIGDGFYQIVAAHSRRSLDINGGPDATWNGPFAQQWDYWGGDNQKWTFSPVTDVVRGRFTYTDTEANSAGPGTFNRPIAGCRVQVWRAGQLASQTETDNDGRFSVSVSHMPDGTDTRVLLYSTNAAAQVLAGLGPFFVTTAPQLSSGSSPLDFSRNFNRANEVRSFNAADDIRLAFNFAQARRDPAETDVIPRVDVSFNDIGNLMTHYNPPAGGLVINQEHERLDLVVMHEYAHFLEDKIGSFLVLPSFHDGCSTTQRCRTPADCLNLPGLRTRTQLINSPENAWMEGFADYFAMAVKRANPMARLNLTEGGTATEATLNVPPECGAVGRPAFDGRQITGEMIENFVASTLWLASSSPGSDTQVFQIFDRELDQFGSLANIRRFHDAWRDRPSFDHDRLDNILGANHINVH